MLDKTIKLNKRLIIIIINENQTAEVTKNKIAKNQTSQ